MMVPLPCTRATMATHYLALTSESVDLMDAGQGESRPAVSGTVSCILCFQSNRACGLGYTSV